MNWNNLLHRNNIVNNCWDIGGINHFHYLAKKRIGIRCMFIYRAITIIYIINNFPKDR